MPILSRVTPVPPPKGTLLGLPNELLDEIKSLIPPWDIRTHFCYYFTCHRIAKLYGSPDEEEALWKTACHLAGVGMVRGEPEVGMTWRIVALECVLNDGFCGHPMCGGTLLEHNARMVAKTAKRCPDGTFEQLEVLRYWSNGCSPLADPHHILQYLAFASERPVLAAFDPQDAYLRFGDNKIPRRALITHPLAYRSYATYPPVDQINVLGGVGDWRTSNPTGVTVWDVQMTMQPTLDKLLTVSELADLLVFLEDTVQKNTMDLYDEKGIFELSDALHRFKTMHALLRLCHWDRLTLQETDEEFSPYYSMEYRMANDARALPGST